MKYDAKIIQKFAARLYASAVLVIFFATLLGAMAGAGFGVVGLGRWMWSSIEFKPVPAGVGFLIGGVIGFLVGQSIAFNLRLRAQIALCQVQIEINTRHTHATLYAMLPPPGPIVP